MSSSVFSFLHPVSYPSLHLLDVWNLKEEKRERRRSSANAILALELETNLRPFGIKNSNFTDLRGQVGPAETTEMNHWLTGGEEKRRKYFKINKR